jgi:protein-L-isoaspartate(D-aspartate) O-methyltransferase
MPAVDNESVKSNESSSLLLIIVAGLTMNTACSQTNYESQRQSLVEIVREESTLAGDYGAPPISDATLAIIGKVPRHEFVPDAQKRFAYWDQPLPIGGGQTISQPYIVALMTDLAEVSEDDVVLEIGTGSGYQAAVLSELAGHVYTIEIIDWLGERAAEDLERLGYDNVSVRTGDGYAGWPEHAPFDAILVTAAPEQVPQPLIDQLAVGGRMVIPVGVENEVQTLRLLTKEADGIVTVKSVIAVRFVPLTRDPADE